MPPNNVITCAGCGLEFSDWGAQWQGSVNLTPDALVVEHAAHMHGRDIVESDIAFDWCGLVCFCRWAFRAAAHLGAPPRPPEALNG